MKNGTKGKRYCYPAIFTPEDNGLYSVVFPDLEGCLTCGDDLADAIFMANDALSLMLCGYEDENREIPPPSKTEDLEIPEGGFANFISCNLGEYRKTYGVGLVTRHIKLPAWMNAEVKRREIDLSQFCRDALEIKLESPL